MVEHDGLGAESVEPDLEAGPGAKRGLLEDQGDASTGEGVREAGGIPFQFDCEIEEPVDRRSIEIADREEIVRHGGEHGLAGGAGSGVGRDAKSACTGAVWGVGVVCAGPSNH